MTFAILGWGSLLWDTDSPKGKVFLSTLKHKHPNNTWKRTDAIKRPDGGLRLNLEFSRVSATRKGALTLVIDPAHCTYDDRSPVYYAETHRTSIDEVVNDLASREGTAAANIGVWERRLDSMGTAEFPLNQIEAWARETEFVGVVWTNLQCNYDTAIEDPRLVPFAPDTATEYLKSLPHNVQREAVEYICRAPSTIDTALRRYLENDNWYTSIATALDLRLRPKD